MVFAVALLLAMVQMGAVRSDPARRSANHQSDDSTSQSMDSTRARITPMQLTRDKLTGEGERLGTAYRLKSGQIVYVPDGSQP